MTTSYIVVINYIYIFLLHLPYIHIHTELIESMTSKNEEDALSDDLDDDIANHHFTNTATNVSLNVSKFVETVHSTLSSKVDTIAANLAKLPQFF